MRVLPAALILALYGLALATLAVTAGGLDLSLLGSAYLWSVFGFSILQAGLSALLSIAGGAILALALNRHRSFPGRRLVLALLAAAAALPAIVVVFGVIALYGRSGLYGAIAPWFGFGEESWIFGLPGILIAHVTLNMPFAARAFLIALEDVPAELLRNASALRFSSADYFRLLDWPALRRAMAGVMVLIFLLCFTSFAIVLSLGGGPGRSTLEVAIYTALRIEVDFGRALALILLQSGFCLVLVLAFLSRISGPVASPGIGAAPVRMEPRGWQARLVDGLAIILFLIVVLPPFLALLGGLRGVSSLFSALVVQALITSGLIALFSGSLAVMLAILLALGAPAGRGQTLIRLAAQISLIVPAFALMAGLFLMVQMVADPFALAVPIVIVINALSALPFAFVLVETASAQSGARFGKLADGLRLSGWLRFRIVHWPALRQPALAAFALAAAFSFGDFGIVAFFGGGDVMTLPLLLSDRLGSYRLEEAGAVALLVMLITLLLSLSALRGNRHALR